ncbi:MAG TPA: nucleoside triphosphate pyrophosphohydrolase [Bacillus sp. (in: firmicutes)]|nr:nucleoside triphosphate pyrophosphohydrolase [Bacillus sp. (in: firmicutes)]
MEKEIKIIGLGAGDMEQMTIGIWNELKNAEYLFLRTKEHPVIEDLVKEGVSFLSFDSVYEKWDTFEKVYEEIAEELFKAADTKGSIVYAVPGHPLVAERVVQILLEKGETRGINVTVKGGQSFLDPIFAALHIDPIEGFQLLDGTALKREELQLTNHILIAQVYDQFTASDVKLTLMEELPDDYEVYIVTAAGSSGEEIKKVKLYELDHQVTLNNLTTVYVPPVRQSETLYHQFETLREIIATLRGPNGCPWDRKQTHESLKPYLMEEAYELIEAIDEQDDDHVVEELGDVLLQIMLHAQIGEDEGMFTISDVIRTLSEKMVRRHPHVFGDVKAEDAEQVIANWNEIKQAEKGKQEVSLMEGVNKQATSLMRAYQYQKAAAKAGFDWDAVEPMWEKVSEEIKEFQAEVKNTQDKTEAMSKEFGDILFALVNIARFYKIDPETALAGTNHKFSRRFQHIEKRVKELNRPFSSFTLEELDQFWNEAKKNES